MGTLDVRGVPMTSELLEQVLDASPRGSDGQAIVHACFGYATFTGDADFGEATFKATSIDSVPDFGEGTFSSHVTLVRADVRLGGVTAEMRRLTIGSLNGEARTLGAAFVRRRGHHSPKRRLTMSGINSAWPAGSRSSAAVHRRRTVPGTAVASLFGLLGPVGLKRPGHGVSTEIRSASCSGRPGEK
jgi:hypothetical protein